MKKVLVFTDGKAGHENQSKAFARALGCTCDVVEIHFKSKLAKVASYLLDRLGIRAFGLLSAAVDEATLRSAGYAAVVGTGSGTFYAVKTMARKLGVRGGVVLYPRGYRIGGFDCILAPAFDNPAKMSNVIEIPANLVANDESFYTKGVEAFKAHWLASSGETFSDPENAVAVIVGGPNKCSTLTSAWMKTQLEKVFAENPGASVWVTTSRRTPPEVEAVVDSYPFAYKLLYSKDHFNPIPAFVKLAKRLYVTAESTGMLSEACTFGSAEVKALDNLKAGPHKFRRFVENLEGEGYVNGTRKVDLTAQFAAAKRLMGL